MHKKVILKICFYEWVNFLVPCSFIKCNSKASTCINRPFYAQCICDYGFVGNGRDYCEECGVTFKIPNVARIVGGVEAVPHSLVLIEKTY